MANFYDKLLNIDSAVLETKLNPDEFKDLMENKFGLRKKSIKDILSFGGGLKYSGEITNNTFKVVQGNPDEPGFFFFTRLIGKYSKTEYGTKVEIKAQFGETFYFGIIPSTLIWILMAYMSTWTLLFGAAIFVGIIGMYGKTQIENDYDKFKSDLSFHTKTKTKLNVKEKHT